MCRALPAEVEHRGINGEAMVLLGPVADPEARGHRSASAAVGRAWVDEADHERHPLTVLGTWQMAVEDARESDESAPVSVEGSAAYLGRHLTWLGACEWLPVGDMARELRQCVAHMERVLHDQSQGDRANVGCFDCGGDLERRLTTTGFEDVWTCRRCRRRYTHAEYNFALRAAIEDDVATKTQDAS
jgi:ribosomal protein L37AE/L43A